MPRSSASKKAWWLANAFVPTSRRFNVQNDAVLCKVAGNFLRDVAAAQFGIVFVAVESHPDYHFEQTVALFGSQRFFWWAYLRRFQFPDAVFQSSRYPI